MDIEMIQAELATKLSSGTYAAVSKSIKSLNQANLDEKFTHFCDQHNLSLSPTDTALIKKMRKARNDIEHGRKAIKLTPLELIESKSIINMLLVAQKS
jgi:hypothetical protein